MKNQQAWAKRAGSSWMLLALLAGCRFGGPAADDDHGPYQSGSADGAGASPDVQAPGAADQAVPMRADVDPAPDADGQGTPGGCGGPFVSAVCDPVCNMGCP